MFSGDGIERLSASTLKVNVSAPSIYLNDVMILRRDEILMRAAGGIALNGLHVNQEGFRALGSGVVGVLNVLGASLGSDDARSSSPGTANANDVAADAARPDAVSARFQGPSGQGVV